MTRTGTVPVRQITPTSATREPNWLGRIDYADAFTVDVDDPRQRTAEQWMRAMLEQAPWSMRLRLVAAWSALGLKLGLPGPNRILGWEVRCSEPDFVLLGADSRIGMPGQLLLRREHGRLLFATLVRHDNALVRTLWQSVVASHVDTVAVLLTRLARS